MNFTSNSRSYETFHTDTRFLEEINTPGTIVKNRRGIVMFVVR